MRYWIILACPPNKQFQMIGEWDWKNSIIIIIIFFPEQWFSGVVKSMFCDENAIYIRCMCASALSSFKQLITILLSLSLFRTFNSFKKCLFIACLSLYKVFETYFSFFPGSSSLSQTARKLLIDVLFAQIFTPTHIWYAH